MSFEASGFANFQRDMLVMRAGAATVLDAQLQIGTLADLFDRFYYEHCSFQRDPFRTGVRVPEPGRSLFLTAAYGF